MFRIDKRPRHEKKKMGSERIKKKDELAEELKIYIAGIWDQVNSGYWDYLEKPVK